MPYKDKSKRKEWLQKNHDRILELNRNWKKENKPRLAKYAETYRKTHPESELHRRINRMVQTAIAKGILKPKPCEICRATKVIAHHDDYSKPLDVRWLCITHHRKIHKK